jgi:hypothetical protein
MTASATFFELAHDPEKLALWQRLDEGAALFQSDRARSKTRNARAAQPDPSALESEDGDNHQAADQHGDTAHREGKKQIFGHVSARDLDNGGASFNPVLARS